MLPEEQLRHLAQRRMRIAVLLTVTMMIIYFGFIVSIAFNKTAMGSLIRPGLSLGILLGAIVIVASWALTWIYVRWTNKHYDAQLKALTEQ